MTEMRPTLIFYVADVAKSCTFYTRILAREPVESSPNFAMYALKSGTMFGLWARHDVQPSISTHGTSGELAFVADTQAKVESLHKRWSEDKTAIAQPPTAMDFGYTFTALDPDGHRVRVFSLPPAA